MEADAKPGDLIFFTGTYNSGTPVSHVGFYAGSGKMLHCGDPIQYESIDTPYWRSHLYGFGRLPYNDETVSVAFGAISDSSMFLQYTGGYAMDECVDMSSQGVTIYGYTFEDNVDFSYEAVGFPSHSVAVQYWDWNSDTWLEYAFPGLDTDAHQISLSASAFPDEYYNSSHALVVRILLIPVIGDPVCSPVIAVFPNDIAVPDIRVVWMDALSQIDFSIET